MNRFPYSVRCILILTGLVALGAVPALALEGEVRIHDPSTIVVCNRRYYTYGTGDRQTVIDDGVSKRLTLKKGPNIVRGAIVNGGGHTDFCARFLDAAEKPLRHFTVSVGAVKRP